MDVALFDYHLPPDRIAQQPIEPREAARLLVLDRASGTIGDKRVGDLPDLLRKGDLLIFNDSKVFKARLKAGDLEIFLLRPDGNEGRWIALGKPGKRLKAGARVVFDDASAEIIEKRSDGTIVLDFKKSPEEVFAVCDRLGEVPVPPYVEPTEDNTSTYQTAYAKHVGSVAAPTAGFHFTPALMDALEKKGMERAFVTLHVGLGTFRPIKTDTLEAHEMHEEWAHVPEKTRNAITKAKSEGRRVIVVGTTAMRALESWARHLPQSLLSEEGPRVVRDWSGFTKLFITPGYEFQVADGLITNFHLPKSTLIVLVSAFAGRESVLKAYQHAINHGYRFYSFGDAMLVI